LHDLSIEKLMCCVSKNNQEPITTLLWDATDQREELINVMCYPRFLPNFTALLCHGKEVNNALELLKSLNKSRRGYAMSARKRPFEVESKASVVFVRHFWR
jgi:hypothetical protein